MSQVVFKLEAFEGPLALLLHLIEKNKVSIYDIPIVCITEQYMEYIALPNQLDLSQMSEFLVIAATLLRIKSQMLLPRQEKQEEETEDPRRELVERLLEYKLYKYISLELKDKHITASQILYKKNTVPEEILSYKEEVPLDELLKDLTLTKLHTLFQSILKKREDSVDQVRSTFGKIEKEEVSLHDKLIELQQYGLKNRLFYFRSYLEGQKGRMNVIVSFLGILELMKFGRIRITQNHLFDDVLIEYLGEDIALI